MEIKLFFSINLIEIITIFFIFSVEIVHMCFDHIIFAVGTMQAKKSESKFLDLYYPHHITTLECGQRSPGS